MIIFNFPISLPKKVLKTMFPVVISKIFMRNNLVISEDDRMSDSAFRELCNKILQCNSKVDKINLINTNVNSLKDFVDILESNCLFEDEIEFLFIQLGDVELSIFIISPT